MENIVILTYNRTERSKNLEQAFVGQLKLINNEIIIAFVYMYSTFTSVYIVLSFMVL